jgi:hypothetical protein
LRSCALGAFAAGGRAARRAGSRDAQRGERLRPDDAVDGKALLALEAAHGATGPRPGDAVGGDAQRALDGGHRAGLRRGRRRAGGSRVAGLLLGDGTAGAEREDARRGERRAAAAAAGAPAAQREGAPLDGGGQGSTDVGLVGEVARGSSLQALVGCRHRSSDGVVAAPTR